MKKNDGKIIENSVPLSQSLLWQLQRNYFKTKGVDAWETDVPFYISTNAFIGHRYALLVYNLMQDWVRIHGEFESPVTILELGAGCGKFSFHFLKALKDIQNTYGPNHFKFNYIVSDVAQKNIDFCKNNAQLKEFVAEKLLDFALVDVESPGDFILQLSQKKFSELTVAAPCIVLANYTFDCIRQEAFEIIKQKLHLMHLILKSRYKNYDIEKSEHPRDLRLEYEPIPQEPAEYSEDPFLKSLIMDYFEDFKNENMVFMIPIAAMEFIKATQKLCKKPLFILSGDKGIANKEHLKLLKSDSIHSFDGCFSFMVNFHALGKFAKHYQGDILSTPNSTDFKVNLLSFGENLELFQNTKACFNDYLAQASPDEFCALSEEVRLNCFRFSLKGILSFLRFSYWDPDVYCTIHDRIMTLFPQLTVLVADKLLNDLKKVEENIYHYKPSGDPYNLLGIIYQMMDKNKKAEELYQKSLTAYGDNAPACHNLGILYDHLGNEEKAIPLLHKALKLDKNDIRAKHRVRVLEGRGYVNLFAPLLKISFVALCVVLVTYAMIKF